jgi:hypothetical protein
MTQAENRFGRLPVSGPSSAAAACEMVQISSALVY